MYSKEVLLKRRAELSAAKQALLEQHRRGEPVADSLARTTIPKRPDLPLIPLSSIQERFWFLQQLDPEGTGYLGITIYQIALPMQLALVTKTFREIARRHEILRTTYTVVDGQVYQQIDPTLHLRLTVPVLDLQALSAEERHDLVQQILIRERTRPVHLDREVPWRATLLHLTPHEYMLILAVHHIIGDGWSVDTILYREQVELYRAYEAGQPSPLPELPFQYADYAYWQRQQLHSPDFAAHLDYWRQHLADAPLVLELPTDHSRPPIQTYREVVETFTLDPALVTDFKAISQQEQVTPFMTFLAAFAILLARMSGQYDMVVGTSVAGRDIPELEALLGCFINTLALHLDLRGAPSFRALLARVRAVCLAGYMHQQVPLEHVVAALQPPRDLSRSTLFQTMFQMQNFPPTIDTEHTTLELPNTTTVDEVPPAAVGQGQCDITLLLAESDRLTGTLDYDATLFEATTIERLLHHFITLLNGIAASPDQPITSLPLLSPAEREQLLVAWNATDQPLPDDAHYLTAFHAQVARTPDAIAVRWRSAQLSYAQLNQQANQLAAWLHSQQVGPEVVVAVLAERDLSFLTAILAVFKAGGAYLPLDPQHPPARYMQVLTQSRPALVLVARALLPALLPACAQLPSATCPPLQVLEDQLMPALAPALGAVNPPLRTLPAHPVYVIYTSGSTGVPKGAVVEQQGMINHLHVKVSALELRSEDRVAQTASQCFDISVWQFLAVGLVGGCVVIGPDEVTHDPARLLAWVAREAVTVLEIVPSVLQVLLTTTGTAGAGAARLPQLRWLVPTGEACPPELCRQWLHRYPDIPLLNAYGPTECSDDVTQYRIYQAPGAGMRVTPIGRPIANLRIYILDGAGEPVPIGVVGELYIGGRGVGRGYLHDAWRTAAAFVPDPFTTVAGGRLYRSGDCGRYLVDGTIEFMGRRDDQVKLRGFRIELGEIEAALARHAAVVAAAVVERADGLGGTQLVAYVVTSNKSQVTSAEDSSLVTRHSSLVSELRGFLKEQLPAYMLPAALMELDALPLTANGKLDRRALPAPDLPATAQGFEAPQTTVEQALAEVWGAVLKRERIGRNDNFFALGGHSLLASQLIYRINEVFALALPLRSLFQEPALADLALAIEEGWLAQIAAHDEPDPLGLQVSWPLPLAASLIDPLLLPSAYDAALTTATPEADPTRAQRRAELAARQAQLPPAQQALLTARIRHARTARATLPPIPARPAEASVPLAFAQEALWLQEQLTPGTTLYNISRVERLYGTLDRAALEQSLHALVQRHEPLRTHFTTVAGQPVQVISPSVPLTVALLDLRDVPPEEREAAAHQFAATVQQPFALDQAPLLRVGLVQIADTEHVVIATLHHLIADGWSLNVFIHDLTHLYSAAVAGRATALPLLPVQYGDYAVWQRTWLQGPMLEAQIAYWKQQLAGAPAVLALPCDHPRPAHPSFAGETCRLAIPVAVQQALRQLSRELRTTLFMTLLAAFQALLGRMSGQTDIVVGVPVAGRGRAELDGMIGCFINTLALRSDLRGTPTFREFAQRVREVCLDGYAHQDLPFSTLVAALQPERSASVPPLFQVMFDLQNAALTPEARIDITGTTIELGTDIVNFDLILTFHDDVDTLAGELMYATDLFEAATVTRLCGHFVTLLEGIVAAPDQQVTALPLLTAAEREQIVKSWNATEQVLPPLEVVHQLLTAQVAHTPDAVALVGGATHLSYLALEMHATQLAHRLQRHSVGPEQVVGLCLDPSPEQLIGLLAILISGAAYLPLDPAYPDARLARLLANSQVRLVLTQPSLRTRLGALPPAAALPLLCVSEEGAEAAIASRPFVPPRLAAQHAAYLIYTSGSTGTPKGVLVPHEAVVNHCVGLARQYQLGDQDRVLQFASVSFDVAVEELFPSWACGATVVLRPPSGVALAAVRELLERERVSVVNLPTPYWHSWLAALEEGQQELPPALRLVVAGSAPVLAGQLARWRERVGERVSWCNAYGVTEATVTSTVYHDSVEARAGGRGQVPIGRPIGNVAVYVLDAQQQVVPVGVVGELYIGGAGLARGYWQRPDLTAERFVPNPFREGIGDKRSAGGGLGWGMEEAPPSPIPHPLSPDTRLYRTGDLGCYRADGQVEMLGRQDRQVKLRGYRIEPGEVEAIVRQHLGVREAAVVLQTVGVEEARLVAYVVPVAAPGPSSNELRAFVAQQVPDYMVPSAYVTLDALPLTPNGKLDFAALPLPDLADAQQEVPFVAPRSPAEEAMAAIWAEILGLKQVGVNHNFFDLGGHSILMNQLMFKVQEVFLVDLPWRSLFEAPTVAELTRAVELARVTGSSGIATKETAIDLNAEVVLDPSISVKNPSISPATATGSVFLTGATGFLGAFLLHELLQRTNATVYCLVRAPQLEEGKARLQSALENYLLWDAQFSARMIPVLGDLAKPRLGLAPREFERIANTVETIYHNGALVNFLYPYKNLKPANVLGTQEVLRMASLGSVKPVHYISTLSVVSAAEPSDNHIREHALLPHSHKLQGGYVQSKWVAEQLVALAHTRGIPVSIYRPGHLSGDSKTGACNLNDIFGHLLKSCIQAGSIPDRDTLMELTPIDYVSKAIVHLAQQPESYGRTYHLFNPQSVPFSEVAAHMKGLGYPLRQVSLDQWRHELVQLLSPSHGNILRLLAGLLVPATSQPDEAEGQEEAQIDCLATVEALAADGIACPTIDAQILDAYFSFFTQTKFLEVPEPGLQ